MSSTASFLQGRSIVSVTDNDTIAAMQILACIARPHRPASGGELLQTWALSRKKWRGEQVPDTPFLKAKSMQRNRVEPKLRTFSKDLLNAVRAGAWLQWRILGNSAKMHGLLAGFDGITTRSLAADLWNKNNEKKVESGDIAFTTPDLDDATNLRRDIWHKRRPVLHMALAASNEIARVHSARQKPSERLLTLQAEWQAVTPDCERAFASGDEQSSAIAEWNLLSKAISDERKNSRTPIELEQIVFDPTWVKPALQQAEVWAKTIKTLQIVESNRLWRFIR